MLAEADLWALYRQFSEEYNATPLAVMGGWHHRLTAFGFREMQAIAQHLSSRGILVDIGTGMGIGPRFAVKLGARAISVDNPATAGTSPIENVRIAGVEAHSCDVLREPLPVGDGVADCVLFADVIEHLLHSPKPVLREIYRVLKPGGACVSTTPNATRLTVRLKMLFGYSNWANLREYFDTDFHGGHHHEYTVKDFRFAFETTGFRIDEFVLYEARLRTEKMESLRDMATQTRRHIRRNAEPLRFRLGKAPLLLATQVFPSLRSSMLLVARKPA